MNDSNFAGTDPVMAVDPHASVYARKTFARQAPRVRSGLTLGAMLYRLRALSSEDLR